ncbi:20055_t:CDS:2 [Dentiscutata erythropus]|uniref:20055_t:CDS:1 n=1 Tax=Dentiscutata erythropus TaxID=1348616 RepID=A0A9N9AZX1_9GLOM|nr:20055_t:CDS:2 [Dentiscutata erythropus]
MFKKRIQDLSLQFEGWEFALSPEQFNLVSILKFRRMKYDFTYKKSVEHTEIFKFVSYIAETATDKKWKEVTLALKENEMIKASYGGSPVGSILNLHEDYRRCPFIKNACQTQWEEVKLFWKIVESEKIDLDERLLKKKLEQAKTQFAVDRYVSGNEAHMIAEKAKLDYIALSFDTSFTTPPLDTSLTTPSSDTSFTTPPLDASLTTPPPPPLYTSLTTPTPDTSFTTPGNKANATLNEMKLDFILNQKDKPIIGSKRTYQMRNQLCQLPQMRPPESWLRSKEKSNSGNIFPNILPNGTILQKPPPTPDFISLSDGEGDNTLIVDNDEQIFHSR